MGKSSDFCCMRDRAEIAKSRFRACLGGFVMKSSDINLGVARSVSAGLTSEKK